MLHKNKMNKLLLKSVYHYFMFFQLSQETIHEADDLHEFVILSFHQLPLPCYCLQILENLQPLLTCKHQRLSGTAMKIMHETILILNQCIDVSLFWQHYETFTLNLQNNEDHYDEEDQLYENYEKFILKTGSQIFKVCNIIL